MSGAARDAFDDPLPEGAIARLGTRRLYQNGVCSLAFSPDGTRLISGGEAPVHVWDAATGREISVLRSVIGRGFSVTFGADRREAFAVARMGTVIHWKRVEKDGTGRYTSLGSAEGTLGFHDGKVVALDRRVLHRAKTLHEWQQHPVEGGEHLGNEDPAAFGGGRLAVATARGEVRIFAVPSAMLRARIQLGAVATAVALSAGDTLAAGFADGRIGLFDVPTRRQLAEWPAHPVGIGALAFSPDGQTLASGAGSRIRLWMTASGGERFALPTFEEPPARLSFHPDAPRIVTRSGLTLQEWDAESGAELSSIPARGRWDDGSRMPDARFAVIEDAGDWTIWDTALGKRTFEVRHAGAAAVSGDGKQLFLASTENEARLVDTAAGRDVWVRDLPADFPRVPGFARFVPGDAWILAGSTYDRLWLLDAKSGATERVLLGPVAVSRDGRRIASTTGNGDDIPRGVEIFTPRENGRRWAPERSLPVSGSGAIRAIAFAPFRPLIAVALGAQSIEIWNLDSPARKPIASYDGTEAHDLVFSPDGRRLASIGWTTSDVLVWDVPA